MQKIIPQRLLYDALITSASRTPDKIAIIAEGRPYSYSELLDSVLRLSDGMLENGFQRGDRCVIYMDNTWACVVSIYATLASGGVFVVVNPQTKAEKLAYILNDCSATILITDSHLFNVFSTVMGKVKSLKCVISSGDMACVTDPSIIVFDEIISQSSSINLDNRSIANDLSALIYTSGSTGNPKGVMQTHLSMGFALDSLIEYLRLSENDRILVV